MKMKEKSKLPTGAYISLPSKHSGITTRRGYQSYQIKYKLALKSKCAFLLGEYFFPSFSYDTTNLGLVLACNLL